MKAVRVLKNAALGAVMLCVAPLCANATPVPAPVPVAAGTVIGGATLLNYYTGNGCDGGSFASCFASQSGVNIHGLYESSSIYKDDFSTGAFVGTNSGNYANITGAEFAISYLNNILSWTYNQGIGDPAIHYFQVKQANGYALFYSAAGITSWVDNIYNDLGYRGLSHVTWFNGALKTGSSGGPGGQEVPEPATLGLFGAALLGLGLMRRRKLN